MAWSYEQDKIKKQEENYQKLKQRREKQRQKKLKQIEDNYQESRRLTKLAQQEHKPITANTYIPEPKKRYAIYRKVFIAKQNGLPHYNSEPCGEPIAEDILYVNDLYEEYFYNPSLSIESGLYVKIPYRIYDSVLNKDMTEIQVGGCDDYFRKNRKQ